MSWVTSPWPVCTGWPHIDLSVLVDLTLTCLYWLTWPWPVCTGWTHIDLSVLVDLILTCLYWMTPPWPVCTDWPDLDLSASMCTDWPDLDLSVLYWLTPSGPACTGWPCLDLPVLIDLTLTCLLACVLIGVNAASGKSFWALNMKSLWVEGWMTVHRNWSWSTLARLSSASRMLHLWNHKNT